MEVAYNHIHHGGLIGKDSALLYTGGWSAAGLHWHHNWIHHATEKCARGDDQSRNMSVHHNVIFNCGLAPLDDIQSKIAGYGLVLKGNGHTVYQNTIFSANFSELCLPSCVERLKGFRPQYPRMEQNTLAATQVFNSAAHVLSAACGCNKTSPVGGNRTAIFNGELQTLQLNDPSTRDYRPAKGSPLIDAGAVVPPFTNGYQGSAPDIGAYEYNGEWWQAGCTGRAACIEV